MVGDTASKFHLFIPFLQDFFIGTKIKVKKKKKTVKGISVSQTQLVF